MRTPPALGDKLGTGGQGSVFELVDHPDLVYKSYDTPIDGAIPSYRDLILAGRAIVPTLERKGITAVWPLRICGNDNKVFGYLMRRIPQRFKIARRTPYGNEITLDATLDQAMSSTKSTFLLTHPVATQERIQLVRLVGIFLQTLHENDVVYGDLSLKNMMFSRAPLELLVMDMDGVHRISARLYPQKDLLHTPDWKDPKSADQVPLGFDLDRYKFALLVYRLLVANNVSAPLPANRAEIAANIGLADIDKALGERLGFLLFRATAGVVGSRPPINEWLAALEDRSAFSASGPWP